MNDTTSTPLVGIVMGSASDAPTMRKACEVLDTLRIPYECKVCSAHRTPQRGAAGRYVFHGPHASRRAVCFQSAASPRWRTPGREKLKIAPLPGTASAQTPPP